MTPRQRRWAVRRLPAKTAARDNCPTLQFEVDASDRDEVYIYARVGKENVGHVTLEPAAAKTLAVTWSKVRPKFAGCGVGTQLYEQAWQYACRRRRRLASDIKRSEFSEGFWRKQARKGRARCYHVARSVEERGEYHDPGKSYAARKRLFRARGWKCQRWIMNRTCPRQGDTLRGRW